MCSSINESVSWLMLANAGYSQRAVGKYLGLSQTAVCHRLGAMRGNPRRVVVRDICDGCWEDFPKEQLDANHLCPQCRAD
jgi:predicted transcriptional regulator